MLDRSYIGHVFDPVSVEVETGQLKFFAKATGETDPVYFDEEKARLAGHPTLPAPPTFLFSLGLLAPTRTPYPVLDLLAVDIGKVLHGEQRFTYSGQIYAGDVITRSQRIVDIYEKKGGALEFIVDEVAAVNQRGQAVGTTTTVTVVRNG